MAKRNNSKSTGKRAGSARAVSRTTAARKAVSRDDSRRDASPRKNALHEPSRPGREVGGKGDFGIPASRARGPIKGGRAKDREQATGTTRGGVDSRETGVGAPTGSPGAGSGGDFDPDIVGLNGRGLANAPVDRTTGPDMTEHGGSAPFASGRSAKGENAKPRGKVGGSRRVTGGDTIDHSGGDVTTSGQALD